MSMAPDRLEWLVLDNFDMTVEDLDTKIIQKPVGELNITVTRWKKLPVPAFRKINAAYAEPTGSIETITHRVFEHGPILNLGLGGGPFCPHVAGALYAVDPDAEDRVEQYLRLFVSPERL